MAATETLGSRVQHVEQRLLPLEAEAGQPQPDFNVLQAEIEQRVEQHVEQRIEQRTAAGLAGQQTRIDGLMSQMESLHQAFLAAQDAAAQRASDTDHKVAGWNVRLDAFAADLARVSLELEAVRTAQAENQHRVAQVQELLSAQQPVAAPQSEPEVTSDATSDTTKAELRAMQTELDALRERLSESKLQQLVKETLASQAPEAQTAPVVAEAPPAAANESLQTELAQLRAKVKTLTLATAVAGALLLVAVGIALFGG